MNRDPATESTHAVVRRTKFRDAGGRLQDKSNTVDSIIAHLFDITTVNEKGQISFLDLTFLRWPQLLTTPFSISLPDASELNPWDTKDLVWDAFVHLRCHMQSFTSVQWAEECDRRLQAYLDRQSQVFTVFTTVSLPEDAQHWIIGLPYSHSVLPEGVSAIPIPPCLATPQASRTLQRLQRSRHLAMSLQVPAVSAYEAVNRAISALSVWKALMALCADKRQWSMTFSGGTPKPLPPVEAASILVACDATETVVDQYWHCASSSKERSLFAQDKNAPQRFATMTKAVDQIGTLPYEKEFKRLLKRYSDALDEPDLGMVVVCLWGLLESLVGGRGEDHKIITKRAVALGKSRKEQGLASDILDVVRVSRNRLVHAGSRPTSEEQTAYLLKPVVDQHLLHLIRNPQSYSRLSDHRREVARKSGTQDTKKSSGCIGPTTNGG